MAEALLGIVFENLLSFAQDQLATFWGVKEQTEKLSSHVSAIQAVLRDAEEKQITRHAVKDWLQKLTDAAYVLDDILDECSIQSIKLQCEAQNPGFAAHSACLTPFHPKNILFRCDIGKRMKKITQRFDGINEERQKFELHAGITERQPKDDEWRQTSSAIREPKVYGRDQDREQIAEFLLRQARDNEDLSIYPIVGMGGMGKTTLAQQVFNDDRVSKHFDLAIWVCVSDDFSMKRILQSIIESATEQNRDLTTLEAMQKKVQEVLQSKRYLLVLDDVWNEDELKWEELKQYLLQRARGTTGSKVLVTTRLDSVASTMGIHDPHKLLALSEKDSWSLFTYHAFGPNTEPPAELEEIGKEIVRKCAGSPLAIKALGSLLRSKRDEKQWWYSIKESKFWDTPEDKDNHVMRALKLSYFNLKLSLRRCFSFCAIFPKDSEIDKDDLIHLWMANGFIKSERNLEVEYVGNETWEELYHRSFFQEVKTDEFGNNTSFKMHDLFHDLAQSVMGEECVVSEPTRLTNLSSRVHHIHALESDQLINVAAFKKVESLRTLLDSYDNPNLHELPLNSPLRALSTSSSKLSALKNLTHLRYLNLRFGLFTSLPNSICELKKLQILKLERCKFLKGLPKDLTQLQDLRHLVIKRCYSLVAMPPNIGQLSCLRTLSTFIVGSKTGFGLAELQGLQLGGKLHIRGLENVPGEWDAKKAKLVDKTNLNHLYLTWGSGTNSQGADTEPERVLEALEPPSNLKSFGIKGYQGIQLPSWMRNTSVLQGLVVIIFYNCKNCERLPPLGKLPHLKTLFISGMKDVMHVDHDSYDDMEEKAFPSLKELTLQGLPNLESMIGDEGVEMLPCLSEIKISGVPKIKLSCLPNVEHLQIYGNEDVASFPRGIVSNMPGLKTLHIGLFHNLKVLPDEFGSLSALLELTVEECHELESFPEHVLQGLTSLRELEIAECKKLKSLSEGVGHLTCLESLELWECPEVVTLPSNMNQLTALREVVISRSRREKMILHIPEGLQRVPSLQNLTLSHVDSLPDWLGDMISLRELHISSCPELRSLPSCLQRLTNLQRLLISECPKQLEKRCKKGRGEDWQNIAHIPQLQLESPDTFCDGIRLAWNFRKFAILLAKLVIRHGLLDVDSGDEFDAVADDIGVWRIM